MNYFILFFVQAAAIKIYARNLQVSAQTLSRPNKNNVFLHPTTAAPIQDFKLTTATVSETANFDELCSEEFGINSRVADWTHDIKRFDSKGIAQLVDNLGISPTFNEKNYFVYNEGEKLFGDSRVYFFEDHEGTPPSNWAAHDQQGDITLGSWYNIEGSVLCIVEPEVTGNATDIYEAVSAPIQDFKLTTATVPETTNFDELCTEEFGINSRVADWTYDIKRFDKEDIAQLIDNLGISPTFNETNYFVYNKGEKQLYFGDSRVYFFEVHEGTPPSNWATHDQQGVITLGSWYGIEGSVLCIIEPEETGSTTGIGLTEDASSTKGIYATKCTWVLTSIIAGASMIVLH